MGGAGLGSGSAGAGCATAGRKGKFKRCFLPLALRAPGFGVFDLLAGRADFFTTRAGFFAARVRLGKDFFVVARLAIFFLPVLAARNGADKISNNWYGIKSIG